MVKIIWKVRVHHFDYFDHFRGNTEDRDNVNTFDSLKEAWAFYKESKAQDYCWEGDHERMTCRPWSEVVAVEETQPKHGYVRGHGLNLLSYWGSHSFNGTPASCAVVERWYTNKPWFKKWFKYDKELHDDLLRMFPQHDNGLITCFYKKYPERPGTRHTKVITVVRPMTELGNLDFDFAAETLPVLDADDDTLPF